jgi:hypothetical protein
LKEATCHALLGRTSEALRQLTELLDDERAAYGETDPRTLDLRKQIGLLQLGSGQRQSAKRTLNGLLGDVRGRPGEAEVANLLTSMRLDDGESENPAWRDALAYLNRDEPAMDGLVQALAERGLPAPVVGYELGDSAWPAELAWPDRRVAVLLSGPVDDPEVADRDAAYRSAGWDARTADAWTAGELAAKIVTTEEWQ